jgi:hypothetical protein
MYYGLANEVVNLLSSLVVKGGESFAEKYGERIADSLADKTNKLFLIIKRKFDGNEDDKKDFEDFQRKPERYSGQIRQILEEKIKDDKAFTSDIFLIIKETQGLIVNINIENSKEKNITNIENNRNYGSFPGTLKDSVTKKNLSVENLINNLMTIMFINKMF